MRTPSQLYSMIFPRMLALAERAWHVGCWENEKDLGMRERHKKLDWEMFANALGHKELRRLDSLNIDYHIPVPGARCVSMAKDQDLVKHLVYVIEWFVVVFCINTASDK